MTKKIVELKVENKFKNFEKYIPVSYTHLRAH